MNDRELLEKAAKACGWTRFYYGSTCAVQTEPGRLLEWNPLEDDGDALRLAVKLRLDVQFYSEWVNVRGQNYDERDEDYKADPYAATRRAIVRAAAEMAND